MLHLNHSSLPAKRPNHHLKGRSIFFPQILVVELLPVVIKTHPSPLMRIIPAQNPRTPTHRNSVRLPPQQQKPPPKPSPIPSLHMHITLHRQTTTFTLPTRSLYTLTHRHNSSKLSHHILVPHTPKSPLQVNRNLGHLAPGIRQVRIKLIKLRRHSNSIHRQALSRRILPAPAEIPVIFTDDRKSHDVMMSRLPGWGAFHTGVILRADCSICAACSYLHIAVLVLIIGDIYISSASFYHTTYHIPCGCDLSFCNYFVRWVTYYDDSRRIYIIHKYPNKNYQVLNVWWSTSSACPKHLYSIDRRAYQFGGYHAGKIRIRRHSIWRCLATVRHLFPCCSAYSLQSTRPSGDLRVMKLIRKALF